jgi:AraC-like DNA-binding protein
MIENYKLGLLSGGFYKCDRRWTKQASSIDNCYKVYFPVAGSAALEMNDGMHKITAGRVYFVSGYRLRRQVCPVQMEVYWIHFVPESWLLRYYLDRLPAVQSWSHRAGDWLGESYREICRIFENPSSERNRPRADMSPALDCRIHGLLLSLVARLLDQLEPDVIGSAHPAYLTLKPALDYMQDHYCENPSLAEIAARVRLAPNYFHRQFRQVFGVTPFNHMLAQRLNKARRLLASTTLTVKEVAAEAGYDNPLYFSRLFARQMQLSPSEYRANHSWSAK